LRTLIGIEKWVNKTINEYSLNYYPITSLKLDDLSRIYLGVGGVSHSPGGRKTWNALWININSEMLPLGLFVCSCCGFWRRDKEYGLLEIGKQKIVLSRNGNTLFIRKDTKIIGEIDYSRWLRLIYFGSSILKLQNNINGKISFPVARTAYLSKDFLGNICFNNEHNIKYLIEAQDERRLRIEKGIYNFPFRTYFLNVSPVYSQEACEELKLFCNNEDDAYVFLIIACWSKMFCTYR
jgi:hypothetical protein